MEANVGELSQNVAQQISVYLFVVFITYKLLPLTGFFKKRKLQGLSPRNNIRLSVFFGLTLFSVITEALAVLVVRHMYFAGETQIYTDIQAHSWVYFIFSILFYCLFFDLYFYTFHRIYHRPFLYKKIHYLHHVAEDVNVLSMTYFHPVESLTYLVGHMIVLFIIPMHPIAISISIFLSVVCNWILHLGYELYPSKFKKYFRLLVSSTYHYDHHQKNLINFGYFSILWDVLLSTHTTKEPHV